MSIQYVLAGLKAAAAGPFPRSKFLIMFTVVVIGPLVLFALAGRNPNMPGQPSLVWSFLTIALLLLISISGGFLMFGRVAKELSISPK